jgi:flagellar protein FlaI
VGAIEMYDLLKTALRQRPDYIVVGEVRGVEAQTLFQAMSTGHTCYSTLHAGDINQMIYRLESDPLNVPRSMLQFLDFALLQMIAVKKTMRVRRTKEISEIIGIDPSNKQILINRFVVWDHEKDRHTRVGDPMKIEKMAVQMGMSAEEIKFEIGKRKEFLQLMLDKNVRDYRVITKLIHAYYRNPENAFEILREQDAASLYSEIVS